ncbi:restriction endonuclease subunit S [Acinetobacter venetianus]|uniref:restriction endonuclease subunit S n=1 Tax=Acinetobacter venetianus TaxID=52133 RepID=UPI003F930FED
MSDWVTAKLKEVAKVVTGKTPQTSNSEYYGGDIPFVSPADLNEGILSETKTYLTSSGADQVYRVPENTVLVSCIGNLGKLAITSKEVCFNQQINGLIFDEQKIFPKYGFYFAQTLKPQLEKASSSTTLPIVNKSRFSDLEIKYPPLEEQRRIASILDQADELRQKRQQAIEKLDQLLQATFIDMFGDPVSNPKGWDKKLLSDLVTIDAPLVEPMEKEFENLLHYGPDRISKDSGKLLPALTAKEDMLISKKFLCDDRHILYSKIRPYLNKVAMVQEKCLCSADVYPVEPKSQLTKHFLWHILRSKSFLDHAETFSNRANIPKINRNQFLQYECIVPTMEAQQKFENISKDIQRQIDFQNLSLESIEKLFSSLQNQAFNGTL